MLTREDSVRRLAALTSVMFMAAAEALAQQKPSSSTRRIVVSLADRKLAVVDSGRMVKIFPTAVGAERSPSPVGSYRVIQRVSDPTWYTKGRIVPPGKSNPLGTRGRARLAFRPGPEDQRRPAWCPSTAAAKWSGRFENWASDSRLPWRTHTLRARI